MSAKNRAAVDGSASKNSRALVQRYSRGNVALQLGRYVTSEEKESRKKRVLKLDFA